MKARTRDFMRCFQPITLNLVSLEQAIVKIKLFSHLFPVGFTGFKGEIEPIRFGGFDVSLLFRFFVG